MNLLVHPSARSDIISGGRFYERQRPGLGLHFAETVFNEIDSLLHYSGVHPLFGPEIHRMLIRRFPFAIYYTLSDEIISVHAVLDCRRNPTWTKSRIAQTVRRNRRSS